MNKIGINGFGRIGRLVLRRLLEVKSDIEVVAINDLTSPKILAYLLKHDSNYGPFPWSVDFTEDSLIVDGKSIAVYAEKEAKKFDIFVTEQPLNPPIFRTDFTCSKVFIRNKVSARRPQMRTFNSPGATAGIAKKHQYFFVITLILLHNIFIFS